MGLDATKPVFGVSEKARHKPLSSATQTSQKIEISTVSSFLQSPEDRFSRVEAQIILKLHPLLAWAAVHYKAAILLLLIHFFCCCSQRVWGFMLGHCFVIYFLLSFLVSFGTYMYHLATSEQRRRQAVAIAQSHWGYHCIQRSIFPFLVLLYRSECAFKF